VTDTTTEGAEGPDDAGGDTTAKPEHRGRRRIRTILATIVIVLASVLAPLAGITVFVRNQLLNTNRYISNIAPLTQNPQVVAAMSNEITNSLFTKVEVDQKIKTALPPKADFLAPQLTKALKSQTYNVTENVISSPQFNKIWLGMNRAVHSTLVKALIGTGPQRSLSTKDGAIVLNLQQLATNVIHKLDAKGVHVFDKVDVNKLNPQITLIHAKGLIGARKITRALNHLALILPILVLVLYLAAIGISPRRRRALMWSGVGLAIAMAVLAIILGLGRSYVVSAAGKQLTPAAAGDIYDTLLRYVKDGLRILFALGLVVAIIAWLTGPSRPAVGFRSGVARASHWCGRRFEGKSDTGRFGGWLERNGGVVQGVLIGIGALLLIILTPGWVWSLVIVAVTAVLVIVVRLLSRGKAPPTSPPAEPSPVASGVA
jgi:hypothetical protein